MWLVWEKKARPGRPFPERASGRDGGAARGRLFLILLALAASLIWQTPARPSTQDIAISELSIDLKHDPLTATLGFSLTNLPLFANLLRNGIRVEVHGALSLERVRTFWGNELLAEKPFSFFLRHDPLSREFVLQRPGEAPLRYKSIAALMEKGFSSLAFILGPLSLLEKDEEYLVRATVGASRQEGSLALAKNVFFKTDTIVPDVSVTLRFDF